MSEDVEQIRRAAGRAGRMTLEARAAATALRRADGVTWQSLGATAYRRRLEERAREMDRCAEGLALLQRKLLVHAVAVDHQERMLARVGQQVGATVTATGAALDQIAPWLPGGTAVRAVGRLP